VDILEADSGRILVSEITDGRVLTFDNVIFSLLKNGSVYTGLYWDYFTPLPLLYRRAKVLVIGLGGGTTPYQLHKLYGKRVDIDVVEISQEMVRQSERFNPKLRGKFNLILGDGAEYIKKCKAKYDIVILDAYESSFRIPKAFLQEAFIRDVNSALRNGGVFAVNYVFTLKQMFRFPAYARLLSRYFEIYKISEGFYLFSNLVLLCPKGISVGELRSTIRGRLRKDSENEHVVKKF
jgi:spermidine synthase